MSHAMCEIKNCAQFLGILNNTGVTNQIWIPGETPFFFKLVAYFYFKINPLVTLIKGTVYQTHSV